MKPNFLVIGAGRCGTTSLCASLEQHPEVFISTPKEPGFFSEHYDRGWPWYESLFDRAQGMKAIGEGTNNYTKRCLYPDAHKRIARDLPDARLIYIVRHPLRRIESDWRYSRLGGIEPLPFEQAVRTNPKYLEASDYLAQIDAYRGAFPDERILVLFLEDMQQDHAAAMERCFAFLGVDPACRVSDRESRNSAVTGLRDRPLGRLLRHMPGASELHRLLPTDLWHRLRPLLRHRVPAETPCWSTDLLEEVTERLQDGTIQFLERYGKNRDFWPMSRKPPSPHAAL